MEVGVINDEEQLLTLHLFNQGLDLDVSVSLVYAKCT